jgi:predicted lipid carrier protein YhbT
MGIFTLPN